MKPNIFQKIAFFNYILIIAVIFTFLVPYKQGDNTYHGSLFSDYGSISFLRFFIYLTIPSIIFYYSSKSLDKMNDLEKDLYKKKARIELYIFSFFILTVLIIFLFFIVNNKYSEIKSEGYENEYKIIVSEKRKNHVVFEDEYVVDNKLYSLQKLIDINKDIINSEYLNLKSVTREKLFHTDKGLYVRESEYTNKYSDFYMINFYEDYDKLIRNKKIFEVKYEKYSPLKDKESKIKKLVFYSEYEIQKMLSVLFLFFLIILYVIRPFLFSFKSMIKEVNNK
jgi:hypothetical protein